MSASTGRADARAIADDVRARVRERLRVELRRHGASEALDDPAVLDAVESLLRRAVDQRHPGAALVTEVLGDPALWRLDTALNFSTHRSGPVGRVILFVKVKILLPMFRWLFEFSSENFARQQRVNQLVFASVQELAIENARLRAQVERLANR